VLLGVLFVILSVERLKNISTDTPTDFDTTKMILMKLHFHAIIYGCRILIVILEAEDVAKD
jgi:hypothetical protein